MVDIWSRRRRDVEKNNKSDFEDQTKGTETICSFVGAPHTYTYIYSMSHIHSV